MGSMSERRWFRTAAAVAFMVSTGVGVASAQTADDEARVFALVDRAVAEAKRLPATPEGLTGNLKTFQPPRLQGSDGKYYEAARERFYAGIAPHLALIGREAERRLEAGMKGKTVRTAETEKAHELCRTTYTNDRAINAAFMQKCVEYSDALRGAACKASLEKINSRTLGHSKIIMAPDENGVLRSIDFDQLSCAVAIDGLAVTFEKPWLFGSTQLKLTSTIMPGHTVTISISKGSERGKDVWLANGIENARPPFEGPLQTLACLQTDKRSAAPGMALDAVSAWWSETLVDNPYALSFLDGATCQVWKNAWNLGQAEPEGLMGVSILKKLIGG